MRADLKSRSNCGRLLASDLISLLVLPERNKSGMPQMIVRRRLGKFKLVDELWLQLTAVLHFADVSPWPHRPSTFSGRFANGQSAI